jgi:hypothetical protein
MKEIPLTQGQVAIVDDEDWPELSRHSWCVMRHANGCYAFRQEHDRNVYMHRVVVNAEHGEMVDHANGDPLDNRRCNLRRCTPSQNNANSKKRKHALSNYKGVSWCAPAAKWAARICVNGISVYLGLFASEQEAAMAYDVAAQRHFAEFARPNSAKWAAGK